MCDKDPAGGQIRKQRRLRRRKYTIPDPNLKWYGFSIHGGIDGCFSRCVLWLEVSTSNKMLEVIAKYYLDAVKRNGPPLNVKADDGTEHSLVQPIHLLLRNIDGSDPDLESLGIATSLQIKESKRFGPFCCETKLDGGNGFYKIW